jgi:hypothetical protein
MRCRSRCASSRSTRTTCKRLRRATRSGARGAPYAGIARATASGRSVIHRSPRARIAAQSSVGAPFPIGRPAGAALHASPAWNARRYWAPGRWAYAEECSPVESERVLARKWAGRARWMTRCGAHGAPYPGQTARSWMAGSNRMFLPASKSTLHRAPRGRRASCLVGLERPWLLGFRPVDRPLGRINASTRVDQRASSRAGCVARRCARRA